MRVLVCGGRDFVMTDHYAAALHEILGQHKASVVVHGAAVGADRQAARIASGRGINTIAFPADWAKHGRAAGPIRNQRMIDEGKPDLVVAFPGGRGTADMIRRARAAGIEVKEISQ